MYENSGMSIGQPAAGPSTMPMGIDLRGMGTAELIELRDRIDQMLPFTSLKEVDLEEQLLLQFMSMRELQTKVLGDEALPLNQRASVANSVVAILAKLTELQGEVYTHERLKTIENTLLRRIRGLPVEVVEAFLADYEADLTSKR